MRRPWQRLSLTAPFLGAAMLQAQTTPPAPPADAPTQAATAPQEVQGGTITGTVTSASATENNGKKVAGTPLPGVTITATNTLTGKKYSTATDVTGSFRMTIPRNGRYVIRAEFAAFAASTAEVVLNATQHEGKAALELELASRVAARTAQESGTTVAGVNAQTLARGLQSLRGAQSNTADTQDASAGGEAAPTLTSIGGADTTGADSVAVSGQAGQINGLAGFNEDEMRNRIQDAIANAQRNGGGQAEIANAIVGMVGGMMQGGPGGFGGPGGGPGGFGGGGGFGGPGGGFGGFGGGGGFGRGGFRNFNPSAIHGNVYYTAGNAALDATQFSITGNPVKPAYSTNRYGIALNGSPYIPGLFKPSTKQNLFLNWTGQHNTTPTNIYGTVPTLAQRNGDFNGLTQPVSGVATPVILYNPYTGTTYGDCTTYTNSTCNVITTPLSAQAQALLQYIPTPNAAISTSNQNYNYQRIATIGNNSSQISARFMRQLGSSAGQGFGGGGRGGGGARGGGNGRQQGPAVLRQNLSANFAYSHVASDARGLMAALDGKTVSNGYNLGTGYQLSYGRLSNSLTLGWNRSRGITTNNFTNGTVDPAGVAGLTIPKPITAQQSLYYGVPGLSFTNFTGISDTQPSDRLQEVFTLSDVVSWRHGKHNFRFGFDGRRQHLDMIAGSNGLGSFSFTGYATQSPSGTNATGTTSGSAFADFLLGAPQTTAIQAGSNKIYLREWIYDFYLQDDYRVRRDITLNYGLRYEYFSPYIEENNRLVNLDHNADFTEYARVVSGASGPYSGAFPRSLITPDRALWSPRIGVAWSPKYVKNTVVRAGYGLNFNVGQYANFANSLSYQQPFAVSQNNTAKVGSTDQGCGNITTAGSATGSLFTLANGFNCTSSSILQNTFAVNKNYRLGRVQVFNMDIQHTFPLGIVTNVGYNGSLGSSLDLRRSPNRTATSVVGNAQSIVYEDSIGDSRFHSLSVNARKRLQKGVSLQATYQYGHSIDDASSIGGVGNNTIVQNDKRIDLEYGNSSFDVRHQVTGNFLYELPFGPNRAFLNQGGKLSKALDNFGFSGTFTFATGTYTTPQYQNTVAQASAGNNFTLRPDRDFSQPITGAGTLKSWFNTKAFTTPSSSVVFGTASRNSIELPGTVSVNMSLSKSIPLGELRNFEGRITASNVFNTVQYTGVNAVLNSSTFGQITSVALPRKLTFDARYRF